MAERQIGVAGARMVPIQVPMPPDVLERIAKIVGPRGRAMWIRRVVEEALTKAES